MQEPITNDHDVVSNVKTIQTYDLSGGVDRKKSRIQRELWHVRRRLRSQRFWAFLAVMGGVAAIFIWMLKGSLNSGQIGLSSFGIAAGVCFGLAFLMARALATQLAGSYDTIAAVIEHRFPSLGQRLLTSVELMEGEETNALTRRVITETHEHYQSYDWRSVVSGLSLWGSRFCGSLAIAAAIAVAVPKFESNPIINPLAGTRESSPVLTRDVIIVPGNHSLEKGGNLVVSAEFSGAVPESAVLATENASGDRVERPMVQNLSDPIMAAVLARIDQPLSYVVKTPGWTSDRYRIEVFEYPELLRSDAALDFPEYTALENRLVADTVKVSVVEGTKITWAFKLNKPVESAELVAENQASIACVPSEAAVYVASMTATENVRYVLHLVDNEGRRNKYPPTLSIRVLPNNPPKLKLISALDVTVSPLQELELRANVSDDYGVQQSGLTYALEGGETVNVKLTEKVDRNAKASLTHVIDFESLGAQPDDMLSFYFWAEDIAGDGTVRRTESDLFFADVRPFEQIFRAADAPASSSQQQQQQSGQAQQAGELAEIQKQIVSAIWNQIRAQAAGQSPLEDDIAAIGESQAEAITMLQEIRESLQDSKSIDAAEQTKSAMNQTVNDLANMKLEPALENAKSAYAGLLKLRAREFSVTRSQRQQQQQQSSSSSSQNRQQQIDELELDSDENRYETQQQAAAQSQQEQEAAEDRQILSRLRELAQRAEDLNEELAELQTALEKSENADQEEEIRRQLKRLREQQQDLLRQSDELESRMRSAENAQRMSEQAEQLQQSRDALAQASQATEENDPSAALAAGRRAEQQFDELEEEFRRRTAGAFDEAVREMVREAESLKQEQERISESMREQVENATPGLRGDEDSDAAPDQLEKQSQRLEQLVESMKETVQEAAETEPLLADKLYEGFRDVQEAQTQQQLESAAELMRRGFAPQAEQFEQEAAEGIRQLSEQINEAAEAVLGDSTESLRRAAQRLERLSEGIDQELNANRPQEDGQTTRPNGAAPQGESPQGESQEREPQQGQRSGEPSGQSQPNAADQSQNSGQGRPGEQEAGEQEARGQEAGEQEAGEQEAGAPQAGQQQQAGQQPGQSPSSPRPGQGEGEGQGEGQGRQPPGLRGTPTESSPPNESNSPRSNRPEGDPSSRAAQSESDGGGAIGPLTGDFRQWSDQMRDVEEMVGDPELRGQAAAIRERVRQMRIEMKRHGEDPKWGLVEEMVADPLRELTMEVKAELLRRTAKKNALVPIDRDPVPAEFTDAVQKYYENLGSGKMLPASARERQ